MNITYKSVSALSLTKIGDIQIGCSVDTQSEGIKPTYGMTAEDMGFPTFIMTVGFNRSKTYKVLIRKNSTGEQKLIDTELVWDLENPADWWWREGNFSYDCNRSNVFGEGLLEELIETSSKGKFTVIHAELPNGDIIKIDG